MKRLLLFALLLPAICFAEVRSKYYKLTSGLNRGLKVASITEGDKTTLALKIHSLDRFEIASGDTAFIELSTGGTIYLICDRPSSYHAQHTASDGYANVGYFNANPTDMALLSSALVERIKVAGMSFDIDNKDAFQKCLQKNKKRS